MCLLGLLCLPASLLPLFLGLFCRSLSLSLFPKRARLLVGKSFQTLNAAGCLFQSLEQQMPDIESL